MSRDDRPYDARKHWAKPRPLQHYGAGPALLLLCALVGAMACAPVASAPTRSQPAPAQAAGAGRPAEAGTSAPPMESVAPAQPELPTSPTVQVNVGILPLLSGAGFFIADARGYFREVGITVEFTFARNYYETLPAVATGQLQVAPCSSNVGCSNALQRATDLRIVADVNSAAKSEKASGGGLVVRQDLWDNGTIRTARDLVGRKVYLIAGEGTAQHGNVVLWLRRHGIDEKSVELGSMPPADQLTAMINGAIEVGYQSEPVLTAGLVRGVHRLLATLEEMHPEAQTLYLMYNVAALQQLGTKVGERFMVAYLRGVRDYINAFEYGLDQEPIISILTDYTVLKDPEVFRQIKYNWIDPNGAVNWATLQADADLFYELGLLKERVDLSGTFEDKYRQFAVQYLGEYRPPR